jgi:ankyrin repeat protein
MNHVLSRDIVELLLSYEASCNSADDKGSSPLHLASWAGHYKIVDVLLTQGPSIANVNLTVRINLLLRSLAATRTRCYAHSLLRALVAWHTRCYSHSLQRALAATHTRCYAHSLRIFTKTRLKITSVLSSVAGKACKKLPVILSF